MKIYPIQFHQNPIYFEKKNNSQNQKPVQSNTSSHQKRVSFNDLSGYVSFGRSMDSHKGYGANVLPSGEVEFRIDAPFARKMTLNLYDKDGKQQSYFMDKENEHDYSVKLKNAAPGMRYDYTITYADGSKSTKNDPRGGYFPDDVDGKAEITDNSKYNWQDTKWTRFEDGRRIISNAYQSKPGTSKPVYMEEIHMGLLGGYEKAREKIDKIAEDGIFNTVLVMPLGEFYGNKNWGYDGTMCYAPESSYGSPDDFKAFVDYAHQKGINVMLDVVPSHLGIQGATVQNFGPYFSNDVHTPWGQAVNYSGKNSRYARNYLTDMLFHWATNFHVDGFRFDAVAMMNDDTALKKTVLDLRNHPETTNLVLMAEDARFKKSTTKPLEQSELVQGDNIEDKDVNTSNLGFDMMVSFDFEKVIKALVSNEKVYNIPPDVFSLEKTYKKGLLNYCDEKENPGHSQLAGHAAFLSNHDEVGNSNGGKRMFHTVLASKLNLYSRAKDGAKANLLLYEMIKSYLDSGEILNSEEQRKYGITKTISKEEFKNAYQKASDLNKTALGSLFAFPGAKGMLMGDSYGELAPFLFFAQYPDINTTETISSEKGYNVNDFAFEESKPGSDCYKDEKLQSDTNAFVRDLAKVVKSSKSLSNSKGLDNVKGFAYPGDNILQIHRFEKNNDEAVCLFNFSDNDKTNFRLNNSPEGIWKEVINSNDEKYGGNGNCKNAELLHSAYARPLSVNIPARSFIILKKVGM